MRNDNAGVVRDMIIGIVAVDRQGAIGKGGQLPWHYSADMKFFRETTTGHACVMGYKTWLTLKKPLKERLNLVLSRHSEIESQDSVILVRDVDTAISLAQQRNLDLFVIGGQQVYAAFLPHIEKWLVTEIPLTVQGADAFVPNDYLAGFTKTDSKKLEDELQVSSYTRTAKT
ncbi:MAG: dihydrofolate reductase [Acidobacteriota bacterium]